MMEAKQEGDILDAAGRSAEREAAPPPAMRLVRQFRQIMLWPLQIVPPRKGSQMQTHWELLERLTGDGAWARVEDEFTGDPEQFQERHYREFVSFLPHVQSFLYGTVGSGTARPGHGESPIRVYRRGDVRQVRMTFDAGRPPLVVDVVHIDLYFFYDTDLVILAFELAAQDLPLEEVQEILFRFARAYPAGWSESGKAVNCLERVEWLGTDGGVLAASDYADRGRYLAFVCEQRAACFARHWEFLLEPMVPHHAGRPGSLRYKQLEYYRMPLMAYLAMSDPYVLTQADYVRLALVAAPGDPLTPPCSSRFLQDFEARYCYDRFHEGVPRPGWTDTRFLCCGHAFVTVGGAGPSFTDNERGVLGQFRHQYFLLFLLAHFHKAALLMLSNRLVAAVKALDIYDAASVRRFRREIKRTLEIFLRFTHRYWFQEVSDQAQARDLFRMLSGHLGNERRYQGLREEIHDMSEYLDSDILRRQSNSMLRLTVVTILGLIGTTTTGFLGMNLIDATQAPFSTKLAYFAAILLPTLVLTVLTMLRSQRLSDFLDTLSDERASGERKLLALKQVLGRREEAGGSPDGRGWAG